MTDPLKKEDVPKDDGPGSPITRWATNLIMNISMLLIGSTFMLTPLFLIWAILMALMWGAGARIIVEVFNWAWNLYGF